MGIERAFGNPHWLEMKNKGSFGNGQHELESEHHGENEEGIPPTCRHHYRHGFPSLAFWHYRSRCTVGQIPSYAIHVCQCRLVLCIVFVW
jgi:hypothetical protein